MVNRMLTAIYVDDITRSKQFYIDLLDLKPLFEADWIVQLSSRESDAINLTLQPRNDKLVPANFRKVPQGFSIVFVVASCDEVYQRALSLGLEIIQSPKNEEYGQRRFLTVDPDGVLVDVSSVCEPSKEFMAMYFGNSEE